MANLFNGFALVSVNEFNGSNERPAQPDTNGHMPIFMKVMAGIIPNRMVLAGTVAVRAGLVPGSTYLVECEETEPSEEYGRQFNWSVIEKTSGVAAIVAARKELGRPKVFDSTQDGMVFLNVEEQEEQQEIPANNQVEN